MKGARARLKGFRQATVLAVAITGVLLLVFSTGDAQISHEQAADAVVQTHEATDTESKKAQDIEQLPSAAREQFRVAADNLWEGFLANLPRVLIVAVIFFLAWMFSLLLRRLVLRAVGRWDRGHAVSVLLMAGFWLAVLGIAAGVLAGDFRALVGSLGLIGLALSWALQTPIESFTGWLLNSFRGYYRKGDRIAVGEVFGDVHRIDVLTTTVWEIGGPDRPPGQIHAEQPTGRLITFPNNEILTGTIVNLTRDFPFVWDELEVPVAFESDLAYAVSVIKEIAVELLKGRMKEPARQYESILRSSGLELSVPDRPEIYVSSDDSWMNITIRYLVDARKRRIWKSELTLRISSELKRKDHAEKIIPAYHRRQVQLLEADGRLQQGLPSH